MSVRGSTSIINSIQTTGTTGLQSSRPYKPKIESVITWEEGTGAGQLNKHASAIVGTAGANVDVDLSGGTHLIDADGAAVTFTAIKAYAIEALDTNEEDVTIGGHGTADWTGDRDFSVTTPLSPGGAIGRHQPSAAGMPVTAGTSDIIRVAVAAATTDKVRLIFAGI